MEESLLPMILKLILASIFPILVFKWRTRSEVVLKQKSPFIIDLFVSLNSLHLTIKGLTVVLTTRTQQEIWDDFNSSFNDLIPVINDNEAKAKLYLHQSTNTQIEKFIDTVYEIIKAKNQHEFMLNNRASFTADDLTEVYNKWSKDLPKRLDEDFKYIITPALKKELNGEWDYIWLQRNLVL